MYEINEILKDIESSVIALINKKHYYDAITLLTAIDEIKITNEKRKETK